MTVPNIKVPDGVKVVWAILSPKVTSKDSKIKNIYFASVYISPKSKFKRQTIAHIVESIQIVRSHYDNDIKYCIASNYYKVWIDDILDSLGSLQNVQVEASRKNKVLDLIITDLHTSYLSTLTLPALDVDVNRKGVKSDQRIIVVPPAKNMNTFIRHEKQVVKIRLVKKESMVDFLS